MFRLSHHCARGPADVKSETDFLTHVSKLGVPVATPIPTIVGELFFARMLQGDHPKACCFKLWMGGNPKQVTLAMLRQM